MAIVSCRVSCVVRRASCVSCVCACRVRACVCVCVCVCVRACVRRVRRALV
jgi:hypothetical protein